MVTMIICLVKFYRWASATSLCSTIGIGGRPSRTHWISKRTISTTRRIICEGKSASRELRYGIFNEIGEMKRARELRVDDISVQNWQKFLRQYKGLHHKWTICKSRWIPWMIRAISRSGIESQREIVLRSQQRFQVLVPCWAATNACLLTHDNVFLVINFLHLIHPKNHDQGIHHSAIPGATGSVPVHIGTGTPVARDEDRIKGTIPTPTFARRPSTMTSLLPVEIPQNPMVVQQKQQISELQFDKFPTLSILCWKIRFKKQVTACSDFPSEGCYGSKK